MKYLKLFEEYGEIVDRKRFSIILVDMYEPIELEGEQYETSDFENEIFFLATPEQIELCISENMITTKSGRLIDYDPDILLLNFFHFEFSTLDEVNMFIESYDTGAIDFDVMYIDPDTGESKREEDYKEDEEVVALCIYNDACDEYTTNDFEKDPQLVLDFLNGDSNMDIDVETFKNIKVFKAYFEGLEHFRSYKEMAGVVYDRELKTIKNLILNYHYND